MPFIHLDPLALEQAREVMAGIEGWRIPAALPAPEAREAEDKEVQEMRPEPPARTAYLRSLLRRLHDAPASGRLLRLLAGSGSGAAGAAHA